MTGAQQIQQILAQYRKHGWALRRVLLCAETHESLTDSLENLFGETQIASFETDAAWFSRPSGIGREAWELRRLTGAPFALVEVFEDEDDETVREEARFEMEQTIINGKRKMIF
jgi:hypothetical protein